MVQLIRRALLAGLPLAALMSTAGVAHAGPVNLTYSTPGDTTVRVPPDVSSFAVTATGQSGAAVNSLGGRAGSVTGSLAVTPGQTLTVRIGGAGAGGTGTPTLGGGGTGGSGGTVGTAGGAGGVMAAVLDGTDFRFVGAGGGGAGGSTTGGHGGDAGAPGDPGSGQGAGNGGNPGIVIAGGTGGSGGNAGMPGTIGAGGAGGASTDTVGGGGGGGGGGATTLTSAGGGGGAGYAGGGGGGSSSLGGDGGGGGGGGASYIDTAHVTGAGFTLVSAAAAKVSIQFDDSTAPAVTLDATAAYNPTTFTGTGGTASDDNPLTISIYSGSAATGTPVTTLTPTLASDGSYTIAIPSLPDGTYTAVATQTDQGGNSGTSTARTFVVDHTPPVIDTSGTQAQYDQYSTPTGPFFTCSDGTSGIATCTGPSTLDTSTVGDHSFTVNATDKAGNANSATVHYTVAAPTPILVLTVGAPPQLGPLVPSVAKDYTGTMSATASVNVPSSLSVSDPSTNAPGHMVNGDYVLPSPLQVSATSAKGTGAPLAALGATPLTVLTYSGPVTNDAITMTFVQHIGATDVLRTGGYAKTLTFTLSTTTP